jgi:hypothetical protein
MNAKIQEKREQNKKGSLHHLRAYLETLKKLVGISYSHKFASQNDDDEASTY